jgi:small subunit ribosomal protein S18
MEKRNEARKPRREMIVRHDCKFCQGLMDIDFRQADNLKKYMTERGKILPRRLSGTCAKHQRSLARAIRQARVMLVVR